MIDKEFLVEYLESEIHRLGKIEGAQKIALAEYLNARDLAYAQVPQILRDWKFGRRIERLDYKINEANIKLDHVVPKRAKLIEQVEALKTL